MSCFSDYKSRFHPILYYSCICTCTCTRMYGLIKYHTRSRALSLSLSLSLSHTHTHTHIHTHTQTHTHTQNGMFTILHLAKMTKNKGKRWNRNTMVSQPVQLLVPWRQLHVASRARQCYLWSLMFWQTTTITVYIMYCVVLCAPLEKQYVYIHVHVHVHVPVQARFLVYHIMQPS